MAWEDFAFNESGMDPAIQQMFASQFPQMMAGFMVAMVLIVVLAVLSFALWIWMIIDCAKKKKFQNGDNVMWILLLVLTGPIGMVLYYFMEVRRSSGRKGK
jgi:hypothetical protein